MVVPQVYEQGNIGTQTHVPSIKHARNMCSSTYIPCLLEDTTVEQPLINIPQTCIPIIYELAYLYVHRRMKCNQYLWQFSVNV